MTQIDNVGIAFVCRRGYKPKIITRKFKAACGSYMTFFHDVSLLIQRVEQEHNNCNVNCAVCAAQYEKAKFLIENGK